MAAAVPELDRERSKKGTPIYSLRCLHRSCPVAQSFGAAKIQRDIAAVKHRQRFAHHSVALIDSTVSAILREPAESECAVCRATLTACDAHGCGGRHVAGWRTRHDVTPY